MLTELHRCAGGPYTSRPALPSRYLSTGAIGPGAREIGRKKKKGKKLGESKQHPRARLQLCICLACLASRLPVLPLLPSPSLSLPFLSPSKVQDARPPHPAALPIVPSAGAFPSLFSFTWFSFFPVLLVRSRSATAQVGSLLPLLCPQTRHLNPFRLASPRLAAVVLSSCPALLVSSRQRLTSTTPSKSCQARTLLGLPERPVAGVISWAPGCLCAQQAWPGSSTSIRTLSSTCH